MLRVFFIAALRSTSDEEKLRCSDRELKAPSEQVAAAPTVAETPALHAVVIATGKNYDDDDDDRINEAHDDNDNRKKET